MRPQLENKAANIVLRGQFTPAIFHPIWFATQNLIRSQEAESADIKIIHENLAVFSVEWLQVNITQDRFIVSTSQEAYYEVLRDLVVGTFTVLNHTPLRVMGINQEFHYALESEKAWHRVGDCLAPKQAWIDVLDTPGMKSLTIQGAKSNELPGYINVKVEPSSRIRFGIYVDINDHYEFQPAVGKIQATEEAIDILNNRWQESLQYGQEIAQKIASIGDSDTW